MSENKLKNYVEGFFEKSVLDYDPELSQSLERELDRQKNQIRLMFFVFVDRSICPVAGIF